MNFAIIWLLSTGRPGVKRGQLNIDDGEMVGTYRLLRQSVAEENGGFYTQSEFLLETLRRLRDLGNTVIVVEHDEDAIRTADHVLDIGPGAGIHGGHIIAQGSVDDIIATPGSLTGKYLSGEMTVHVPERRPKNPRRTLKVVNARGNNLKNVTAEIPLGLFTCVTGVSGGGKSTLMIETLYKAMARKLNAACRPPPHTTGSKASSTWTR